jgi:hypothetical protein
MRRPHKTEQGLLTQKTTVLPQTRHKTRCLWPEAGLVTFRFARGR